MRRLEAGLRDRPADLTSGPLSVRLTAQRSCPLAREPYPAPLALWGLLGLHKDGDALDGAQGLAADKVCAGAGAGKVSAFTLTPHILGPLSASVSHPQGAGDLARPRGGGFSVARDHAPRVPIP